MLGIGNGGVPKLGSGNRGVRAMYRRLESGMEEFEPSSMMIRDLYCH